MSPNPAGARANPLSSPSASSHALLVNTFAHIQEGISVIDAELRLVAVNARAIALSGLTEEQVPLGVHFGELLHLQALAGEFGEAARAEPGHQVRHMLQALKHSPQLTYERVRPDGTVVEVRRNAMPDGGFLTLYLDVTARHHFRRALLTQQFALDSIADSVSVIDTHRRYLMVNDAWCRAVGCSRESVIGRLAEEVVPNYISPEKRRLFDECLRTHTPQTVEYATTTRTGEAQQRQTTFSPYVDDTGMLQGVVLVTRDITRQHAREVARQREDSAQRDALVREVHHRIKNNLHGITALLAQFARREPLIAPLLEQAIGQVNSIAAIYGLQAQTRHTAFTGLLRAIVAQVQDIWQIEIAATFPPPEHELFLTETEAVPVALILNELLVNSLKHSHPERARVSLRVQHRQPSATERLRAVVHISNRGHFHPLDDAQRDASQQHGLKLLTRMMPRSGAMLNIEQNGDWVITHFELTNPVVCIAPA